MDVNILIDLLCLFVLHTKHVIVSGARQCIDLDPESCIQMATQRASMCTDNTIATMVCPSYCGTCTPSCYDCQTTRDNYTSCTTVTPCQTGQKCILLSSDSTYIMRCASTQMCDALKRRELRVRNSQAATCCSSDRCNFPPPPTTATTPSLTTTQTPVAHVVGPGCRRDIEFMIQDSTDHRAPAIIKQYLKDMVNRMEIGYDATMMDIILFDTSLNRQHTLRNKDNVMMLNSIDNIDFHTRTNQMDRTVVENYLRLWYVLSEAERTHYPNVIIILVDHGPNGVDLVGRSVNTAVRSELVKRAINADVIVINVGVEDSQSPFSTFATDLNHVISMTCLVHYQSYFCLFVNNFGGLE